jgi:N-carbamoyl-L-amino-acid hydrolase
MAELSKIRINRERLWGSLMSMAEIGPGAEGGSCRLALTDEDRDGRNLFVKWCREAGCSISLDDMGNIFAHRTGRNSDLAPIVAGSHLDTQPHGGKFDGVYGVLAALEVIRTMNDYKVQTEAPIEAVVWTNEEGSRFAPAMIASGVYAGLFDKEYAWSRTDSIGITLVDELKRIEYFGDQPCGAHTIGALLEAHIEQGPILEDNNNQIGVVIGAQGQRWFDLTAKGQDSHAGSTPMTGRRDALVASAEIVTMLHQLAHDHAPDGVATVGQMTIKPNSRNTIPGEVFFTVDMRNPDDGQLKIMADTFRQKSESCAARHQVALDINEIWHNPPVEFDQNCIAAVANAVAGLDYSHQQIVSGAGHDACQVCRVVPTSMIFVPCAGGLSHNEQESAEPEDLEAGCNVLLQAMIHLATQEHPPIAAVV